jgi:hypothetical protein
MTIQPPVFDSVVAFGILGLTLLVLPWFVRQITSGHVVWRSRLALGAVTVTVVTGLLAWSGQLARFDLRPPPMALLMTGVLAMGVGLGLSRIGSHAVNAVPLAALVGLQAFRLPLELVMHRAAGLGIMPLELSYSGYNFDILTGCGAALLFLLFRQGVRVPHWLVWIWNAWGWWSLTVITFIAVGSSPLFHVFGTEPRQLNTWVLFFPYVWLPAVLVTIALAGHVLVTRALLRARTRP